MEEEYLRLYKSAESYARMQAFYDNNLAKYGDLVTSQYVDTRFGKTHMLVAGPPDAPPLIMLQGMAGSAILWHHQLEDFAQTFRLFALDTVGQPGRSAPNPPSIMANEYVLWLLDVVEGLKLQRPHMMGISSGSWSIIQLGIEHPQKVGKAILLSPLRLARAKLDGSRWVGNALKKDTEDDKLEDRLTTREFSPSSDGRQYDMRLARAMALSTRHFNLTYAMGIDPQSSRWQKLRQGLRVVHFFTSPAKKSELAQFSAPCLVIMGEHESLYNPQKAARRAAAIPNAQVIIVPGAGHAAVFDKPEVINPVIIDFLNSD